MPSLHQTLHFQRGEWARDTSLGGPWREIVYIKNPNLGLIRSMITQIIETTAGVDRLQDEKCARR